MNQTNPEEMFTVQIHRKVILLMNAELDSICEKYKSNP